MNKIIEYLKRPFPVSRKPWLIILIATFIIFFLFALFVPFGKLPYSRWFIITGISLVTTIVTTIVCYLFPLIFKKFYQADNWTIGKNIINSIIILTFIAIGNFAFDCLIFARFPEAFLKVFLSYLYVTFLVGIIPMVVITFVIQNIELKRNLKEAKELNKQLLLSSKVNSNEDISTDNSDTVILSGTTKDAIELSVNKIIYIESSGNYVKVNYLSDNNIVRQKQLRNTISKIEEILQQYPDFIRTHRAFLVNASHIIKIDGNSQGYLLGILHIQDEIPVSRTYIKTIKSKLKLGL